VVMRRGDATAISESAVLKVEPFRKPEFMPSPAWRNLTVRAGERAEWGVGIAGDEPMELQWEFQAKDGPWQAVAGAEGRSFAIAAAGAAHEGAYRVTARNAAGSVTNGEVMLTLLAEPALASSLTNAVSVLSQGVRGAVPREVVEPPGVAQWPTFPRPPKGTNGERPGDWYDSAMHKLRTTLEGKRADKLKLAQDQVEVWIVWNEEVMAKWPEQRPVAEVKNIARLLSKGIKPKLKESRTAAVKEMLPDLEREIVRLKANMP
jgi:hypothetical protein